MTSDELNGIRAEVNAESARGGQHLCGSWADLVVRLVGEVERLQWEIEDLTECDCGRELSRGKCRRCDGDE